MRASDRIRHFVAALPLRPGLRVLEIGCGPGVAARLVAARVVPGMILAIDRSARAVAQAKAASVAEIAAGSMMVRHCAVEHFTLDDGETPFDLAFAMRVGALDGRHPEIERRALECIRSALVPGARLFIDGGDPLREIVPLR
ncbi:cyclopropane-fatty-acyl-phospholipid synthase family protein [Tabrizicola sp.]|uniref:SAM-dependent methyltransferase n=1 Tax=Tabrizicola sp. TaxID=2005166 RepID=UPI0025F7C915|nr:class I SAM-dependent methyltransferase [Tabrizicola sp.]